MCRGDEVLPDPKTEGSRIGDIKPLNAETVYRASYRKGVSGRGSL